MWRSLPACPPLNVPCCFELCLDDPTCITWRSHPACHPLNVPCCFELYLDVCFQDLLKRMAAEPLHLTLPFLPQRHPLLFSRLAAIMQCPTCQRMRSKASWRPSQWQSFSAITEKYCQCKVCDGERPDERSWSWCQSLSGSSMPSAACSQRVKSLPHQPGVIYEASMLQDIAERVEDPQGTQPQLGSSNATRGPCRLHVPFFQAAIF